MHVEIIEKREKSLIVHLLQHYPTDSVRDCGEDEIQPKGADLFEAEAALHVGCLIVNVCLIFKSCHCLPWFCFV